MPETTFSAPRWLAGEDRDALAPLAMFDLGSEPCELMGPPWGNNMAYRRDVFEKYGEFRTELGPSADCVLRGEDTEFGQRLFSAGERLRYEPSAIVYHATPKSRIQKRYFLDWWFDKGRSEIREFGVPTDTSWFVAGIPLYLFRRFIPWTLAWMFGSSPSLRFFGRRQVWWVAGTIQECYRQAREPRRIPVPNRS